MTNWIHLSTADIEDYLIAAQLQALRNQALGDTQDDPVTQATLDITQRVRAEVASCPRNRISATLESIPPELKVSAIALIIEAAQSRIPYFGMTEEQARNADNARALLERVAAGTFAITQPSDPHDNSTLSSGGSVSVEHYRQNRIQGNHFNGL